MGGMGGDTAGRQVVDAFRTSFLPFEWRQLGRTGIALFGVLYWSDVFASMVGRGQGKVQVKYDRRDLSQVWVTTGEGRVIPARYRDLSHPRISLWESRRARKDWQEKHGSRIDERVLFQLIDAQRRQAEAACQKTRTARLEIERDARLPRHQTRRDPSREMFMIDTGNPDLPTYEIDEFNDPRRMN